MGLRQDPHNANRGTKRGRDLVSKSLKELGAGRSIVVDKHGTAIAGNKTLEAAEKLGLPVEVVETDGSSLVVVQRTDLDLEEPTGKARKLAYADNRAGEVGLDWDSDVLRADLELGLDLSELGFDPKEDKTAKEREMELRDSLTYSVIVDFEDENQQADFLGYCESKGYSCRLLIA